MYTQNTFVIEFISKDGPVECGSIAALIKAIESGVGSWVLADSTTVELTEAEMAVQVQVHEFLNSRSNSEE